MLIIRQLAFLGLSAILVTGCSTGYSGKVHSSGIEVQDLRCAKRILVGEDTHMGMPHMPRNEQTVREAKKWFRHVAPEFELVHSPAQADFIVSVLTSPKTACSHCQPVPDSEWVAIVERGGPSHKTVYDSVAPFLEISGSVREGSNPIRAFVKQFKSLALSSACSTGS